MIRNKIECITVNSLKAGCKVNEIHKVIHTSVRRAESILSELRYKYRARTNCELIFKIINQDSNSLNLDLFCDKSEKMQYLSEIERVIFES
jgi:hypothetical protein